MGYESRVYIIRRGEIERSEENIYVYSEKIAEYNLCCMPDAPDFFGAFRTEIDYDLYLPGCDNDGNECIVATREDKYGQHMKSADISEVIAALERVEANDHYRRLPPLIDFGALVRLNKAYGTGTKYFCDYLSDTHCLLSVSKRDCSEGLGYIYSIYAIESFRVNG